MNSDILILGGGPGGYVAAIYAAKMGKKVVLVEKERLGGTCLNVGCIPTKALVRSSEVYHLVKTAEEFGIELSGEAKPNMDKIIDRKDEVKDRLVSGIEFLMKQNGVTVVNGTASFVNDHEVTVNGESYEATDIIVATGSKISRLPIPGLDLPVVLDSTTALSLKELPESITIIGGGVIGMEFAFLYSHLGVKVTIVEFMDSILSIMDEDVSKEVTRLAKKLRITLKCGCKVQKVELDAEGKALVTYEGKKGEETVTSDKVLVAIGREPNMDDLNVEAAGLILNDRNRGIKVDDHMRTNKDHIYAIGDINNRIMLAHVASHQGITAVKNICGEDCLMDETAVPSVVFTSPEAAQVGLTEKQALERGFEIKTSKFNFRGNGKALTLGEVNGFCKLIMDVKTGELLGGSIVGPDASALISTITVALHEKITPEQLRENIFAHPTTGEVIHEAAMGLDLGYLHQ